MTLVGDVVMLARDLMQDAAQTLGTPPLAATGVALANTLPAGTYVVLVTQKNQWGESVGSVEVGSIVVNAGQAIQVTSALLPGATTIRAYFGIGVVATNAENQWVESTVSPFNITAPGQAGAPPPTNSAYLPDTDGNFVRASAMFRWLNEALNVGSRLAGGLPDYSGISSVINYPTYKVTGEWTRVMDVWYDGYPLGFSAPITFFKRNQVTSSILAALSLSVYNNQMLIETWPQAARTATQTTLSVNMAATDTAATLTTTAGFLLPTYGMAQIGTEIVAYNGIGGGQLQGLIRGLGGTVPSAWANGTTVSELNLFFRGRRVFTNAYSPGQSALTLPVPTGWAAFLCNYLMYKFYTIERDAQSAKAQMDEFKASIKEWARTNREISGPQQVGDHNSEFTVFGGTRFGGNVIP